VASIARANGVVTRYSYDGGGRPVRHRGIQRLGDFFDRLAEGRCRARQRRGSQPARATVQPRARKSYTYDAADQISGATYDALGRIVKDSVRTSVFDLASRLTSYSGADGSASFT